MSSPPAAWRLRLNTEFDAADQQAKELVMGLSAEQLNWQPQPGAWSVGQCLEHLCAANEIYLPPMSSSLVNRRASAVHEITPGWFGRWFITNYIEPSARSKRARAPKKIVPHVHVELSILDRFLRSNDGIRQLVREASNYDVNHIRFVNPFVPLIRFTVGTGFEILSKHERRHLLQAERVKQDPAFPA